MASLISLWLFGAWVTVADTANLYVVNTHEVQLYEPSEPLLSALQVERRLSAVYLGRRDAAQYTALKTQQTQTKARATEFAAAADRWEVQATTNPTLTRRIADAIAKVDRLNTVRTAIDDRTIGRADAAAAFTEAADAIFHMYHAMASLDDLTIASRKAALIGLHRSWELMSREDALLAGAIADGRLSSSEHAEFVRLVNTAQSTATEALFRLPDEDRDRYERATTTGAFTRLRALETRVTETRPGARPPVTGAEWRDVTARAMADIHGVVLAGNEAVAAMSTPVAMWAYFRMLVATGLGLALVVASLLSGRTLVRQLDQLRRAARELAEKRLPDVVERISRGDRIDAAVEAPPLARAAHEVGQVTDAFNTVQRTALRTAAEQAELRQSVRVFVLSIARRTQALVHRQLTLLSEMQQRQTNAQELEDLFRVDHLATRMRRNAENLIVLSGASAGRRWRRGAPMFDVVRSATGEVEGYERVSVLPMGQVRLAGSAVGDVIHLLAELIENGLALSPPHTPVEVRGDRVAKGFAIDIEDRGLGMSGDDLAAANARIASEHELQPGKADMLGLYVVSKLAARQGVRVRLKTNAYGGITAVVLIPTTLLDDQADEPRAITGTPSTAAEPAATGRPEPQTAPAVQRTPSPYPPPSMAPQSPVATRTMEDQATSPSFEDPAELTEAPPHNRTSLPVRTRQASLHPQLASPSGADTTAETRTTGGRTPEEVRSRISNYRLGTMHGRAVAEGLSAEEPTPDR